MHWELVGDIVNPETFAEGSKIRELHRLLDTYGGKNWKKCKGFGWIRLLSSGEIAQAEIHWYEAHPGSTVQAPKFRCTPMKSST